MRTIEHWTVIRSVGERHLNLYNNSGLHRWKVRRCRFHRQELLPLRSKNMTKNKGVFVVSGAASLID
jgi:hypothetical protein